MLSYSIFKILECIHDKLISFVLLLCLHEGATVALAVMVLASVVTWHARLERLARI